MVNIKSKIISALLIIMIIAILIYPSQEETKIEAEQCHEKDVYLVIENYFEETGNKNIYYNVPLSYELQDFIRDKCKEYEVNMKVILSIMSVESDFTQEIKSKNNIGGNYSVGIMQLNNNHIDWFAELTNIKEFDINNIYHNIEGGIAVYKNYNDYWRQKGYKDKELKRITLLSYNRGICGAKKHMNLNDDYIEKVIEVKYNIIKE